MSILILIFVFVAFWVGYTIRDKQQIRYTDYCYYKMIKNSELPYPMWRIHDNDTYEDREKISKINWNFIHTQIDYLKLRETTDTTYPSPDQEFGWEDEN